MWTRTVVRRPATRGIRDARSWMPWVTSMPRTETSGTISPGGCASPSGADVVEMATSSAVGSIGGSGLVDVVWATSAGDVVVVVVVVVWATSTGDVVVVVVVVVWATMTGGIVGGGGVTTRKPAVACSRHWLPLRSRQAIRVCGPSATSGMANAALNPPPPPTAMPATTWIPGTESTCKLTVPAWNPAPVALS